jgi:hypothetical protein
VVNTTFPASSKSLHVTGNPHVFRLSRMVCSPTEQVCPTAPKEERVRMRKKKRGFKSKDCIFQFSSFHLIAKAGYSKENLGL